MSVVRKSTGYIYGTSGTITLPSVNATDGILIFLGYDNNGTISYTIDTASYTKITTQNTANRSIAAFYKENAAGTEATIALSGLNGTYSHPWEAFVIPGAHTTAMMSTTVTANGASSNQPSGTTYTTGHDDVCNFFALNIDSQRWSNWDQATQHLADVEAFTTSASAANRMQCGYQSYPSTGTTTAPRAYINATANWGMLQVPVRMASNSLLPAPVLASHAADVIQPLMAGSASFSGAYGGSHDSGIAVDFSDIDGHTTIHDESTFSSATGRGVRGYNWSTWLRVSGGSEQLGLAGINITEVDLSGERLMFNMTLATYAAFASYAAGSCYFGIRTDKNGTLGWRVWRLPSATATPDPNGFVTIVLDVDNTDYVTEVGTYDSTKVDGFLLGVRRETQDTQLYFNMIATMNTMIMAHGSSGNPLTFDDFVDQARTYELKSFNRLADGQYEHSHDWQIGDGTTPVHFEQDGFSVLSVAQNNEAAFSVGYRSSTLPSGGFVTSANCTLKPTNCTFSGATQAPFVMNLNAGTTVDTTGLVVDNKILTWTSSGSANKLDGAEFRRCSSITLDFAQVITVNNTSGATGGIYITGADQATLQTELNKYAGCALKSCGIALYINYTGAAADISLTTPSNLTWSGCTTDVHYISTNASGLTLVMGTGGNASTSSTGGAATGVTISNDVTLTLTISDANAEVSLLNRGATTVVDHTETATTTYTYTYTYSGDVNLDVSVFLPGFEEWWSSSITLTNTSQSIDVQLVPVAASQNAA